MHLITMPSSIFLLAASIVCAASIPGHVVDVKPKVWKVNGTMTFKGKVGGHYIEKNGTIQSVIAEAQRLNPDYVPKQFHKNANHTKNARDDGLERRQLHDGDAYVSGRFCCPVPGQWFSRTSRDAVYSNTNYLRDVDGWCGVGGNSCIQVATTYDGWTGACSGLILCNEDWWGKNIDCGWVAYLAEDVVNNCGHNGDYSRYTCGQEFTDVGTHNNFDEGRINVVVSAVGC